MPINILNNFKKKRGRVNDMQVKSQTNSRKAKAPDQGQCSNDINIPEVYSDDMLFMPSKNGKIYKNYGLLNIFHNDLSSIPLSLYNPTNYLRRREMGFNSISKIQPLSLRYLLKSFVSTDNDIYKCNDEEQSAIIPPFACRYNNGRDYKKLLAIADEIGNVRIINTEKEGEIELKTQWLAHENAIFDIAWSLDDKKLITAGGDQTALLWDIETNKCISGFQGHVSSIKSIVFHNTNPFICASGAREGSIMIWDLRCTGTVDENGDYIHKPANIIRNAHVPVTNNSLRKKKEKTNQHIGVAAVHFLHKPGYLASAGTADGLIKFWDIRSNGSYLHRSNPVPVEVSIHSNHSKRPHGFSSLSLDSTGRYLFSACTDNSIYMYNTLNLGKPVYRFTSPTYKCSTFYIKTSISPDDRFIASGSSDNNVYIWDITAPHRSPVKLKGHENEVTAVSWCPIDIKQMVTCSDDTSIRIWNMNEKLENKCKNDLFLKTTWGHAVEEIPIETRDETPNVQVNKENLSNITNTSLDSNSSPSNSFFNFPNTVSYSYDSNDSPCSSSPLSRFKYQSNAILLEDEASTSSIPSTNQNSLNRSVSASSILFSSSSSATTPTHSNHFSRSFSMNSLTPVNPFYISKTPTKDFTTPSQLINDSPLSSAITDYFSTLSTRSPMPTIPPPRISNSSCKRKQGDISLLFLRKNESSVSFIKPNDKLSSITSSTSSSSVTESESGPFSASFSASFSSSPLSKKVVLSHHRSKSTSAATSIISAAQIATSPSPSSSTSPSISKFASKSSSTSQSVLNSSVMSTPTKTSIVSPASPKISRLRLTSPFKRSSVYNQSTLQQSFTSASNLSSSSSSNLNTLKCKNKISTSDSLIVTSSTPSSECSSATASPSSSVTNLDLSLNTITKLELASSSTSTVNSIASSAITAVLGSQDLSIVSPPSSPCTSTPSSPIRTRRKRTLMDYFSPNTNHAKKKKQKAKAIDSSDEEDTDTDI
ncbi:WD40 repeat-like protein [Neocallimastix californiae]|uniref:WD40 repeat-like protein n=1 Tax=Neocallimastix californiae TaxID=1754190 RepID=A0A1Y2CYW6_9FUNG|nr:WD40 repeat-like protein [Neocallimastix californiae]|eukprot:ORY52231.1 WD40 repeat-like protein [Neocallimastix californiae]